MAHASRPVRGSSAPATAVVPVAVGATVVDGVAVEPLLSDGDELSDEPDVLGEAVLPLLVVPLPVLPAPVEPLLVVPLPVEPAEPVESDELPEPDEPDPPNGSEY